MEFRKKQNEIQMKKDAINFGKYTSTNINMIEVQTTFKSSCFITHNQQVSVNYTTYAYRLLAALRLVFERLSSNVVIKALDTVL